MSLTKVRSMAAVTSSPTTDPSEGPSNVIVGVGDTVKRPLM